MDKTLLAKFTAKTDRSEREMKERGVSDDMLNLLQEMKEFLKEATTDLLQPRPEVIAKLLQEVHH